MTPAASVDIQQARLALISAARRNAELIDATDLDLPVKGSDWTVGETAAHLVIALRGFASSVSGDHSEWRSWEHRVPQARAPERIAAMNRLLIAAEPRRSAPSAARAITAGVEAFLAATADVSPGQAVATPWYGDGASVTVAEATCLLLGEQVLHGYDIARSLGRKWPITSVDAVLIFGSAHQMLPRMADPNTLGKISANYEMRLGRSARFVVRVADGAAIVEAPAGQRIDCHILADPVALLLVGYGRTSHWRAIRRAKMITWGRRPWLAFRFTKFFSHP